MSHDCHGWYMGGHMPLTEEKPSFYLDLDSEAWVVVAPDAQRTAHSSLLAELIKRLHRDDKLGSVRRAYIDGQRGVFLQPSENLEAFKNLLQETLAKVWCCSPDEIIHGIPRQRELQTA